MRPGERCRRVYCGQYVKIAESLFQRAGPRTRSQETSRTIADRSVTATRFGGGAGCCLSELGERCPAGDRQRIAARLGAGKKQVKLVDVTVARLTGYPAGGVPPFGHATPLPGLLAAAVRGWEAAQGGGRDDPTLLRIAAAELARVTGAKWIEG